MVAQGADGHGAVGGHVTASASKTHGPKEAERRQILAILDQGDRDIAAGNGRDWAEVKQRMRERIAARTR
jgi:hypothetical protein